VTTTGTLTGEREGEIGEAEYAYPEVQVNQLYLWPEEQAIEQGPGVNFGLGVGIIF
jgi:outer membrane lipoprotein